MYDAMIAALRLELKSIHVANVMYWTKGAEVDRAARAEHFRRRDRVLEIRAQFIALDSALTWLSRRGTTIISGNSCSIPDMRYYRFRLHTAWNAPFRDIETLHSSPVCKWFRSDPAERTKSA